MIIIILEPESETNIDINVPDVGRIFQPQVITPVVPSTIWRPDDGIINYYSFNPKSEPIGVNPDLFDILSEGNPFDFFKLMVNDSIIQKLVDETNRYA